MVNSKIDIKEHNSELNLILSEEIENTDFSFVKIFKNFSFLSLGQISGDVFTFALFVVISRIFGEQGIGQYSFAMGLTGFFAIVADFGLYHFSVKEISSKKENFQEMYGKILSIRIFLSTAILLIMLSILPLMNFSYETKIIIVIIGLYQILYKIVDGSSAVFVAKEKMQYSGLIESSMKISIAIVGIVTAYFTNNIILVLSLMPFIAGIQIYISTKLILSKIGKFSLDFSIKSFLGLLKRAKPFGFSELLNQIYARIDIVLIGFLLGESSSGIYNVAFRIIFFLQFIPIFASIALFPSATKLYNKSKIEITKFYNDSLKLLTILAIPITAGIWLFANDIILLLFGNEFTESILILKILSSLFILKCFSSVMGVFLFACNKQNEKLKDQFATTVVSIISNLILIMLYGIIGAAIAITLAEFLLVTLYMIRIKNDIGLPNILSRFAIASFGSILFVLPFFIITINLFLAVILSVVIYFLVLISFREIREQEGKSIMKLFPKKN